MARFVPGLATMAPPLAGTIGMPFGVFLTFQSLAALLFSITGLMAGYFFNENVVALVSQIQQHGEIVVYALSTALLIWLLYVFVVKHRY
jgi:membrane protein DedA with SNARE-associated domain